MATPTWQPGKLYPPGSLVRPLTELPTVMDPVTNGSFEDGTLTGWSFTTIGGGGALVVRNQHPQVGAYAAYWAGGGGSGSEGGIECVAISNDREDVTPGLMVQGRIGIKYNTTGGTPKGSRGQARLYWFDDDDNQVGSPTMGTMIQGRGNNNRYVTSSVQGVPPAGATKVAMGVWVTARGGGSHVYFDNATWNYSSPTAPEGLIFKAVQPAAGYSAASEPVWPITNGVQVVDNEVIWEAIIATRVVWQASPIMRSGLVEPDWPLGVGVSVDDNTVTWEAVSLRIEDPNCPNSKIVTILKMKVYAGAKDIVRYCATLNARDWTSERDAGFLGTGLNQNGANDVSLLNVYRSNLVVMNATTFQQWQVDPDPAMMSMLDTMEGIGSTHQKAAQPVANDLFYLASLGVRTIGISAATENMRAGDIGLPIDKLVQEAVRDYAPRKPISMYFPSSGQYWLIFGSPPDGEWPDGHAQVFVYTLNQVGQVGAWSRYVFPFDITYACQKGDAAYVRTADTVLELNELFGTYDYFEEEERQVPFDAVIQWPWLDCGSPGAHKMMHGFDIVGYGVVEVEFGYDQTNTGVFTDPYEVVPDTLTGQPIMFPLTAPSFSVRLTYRGGQNWGFNALNLYLDDGPP